MYPVVLFWLQSFAGGLKHNSRKAMQRCGYLLKSGPEGIQTHNLLIRSQVLYSVELRNLKF